ncbi:hypothetical protein [Poseidonocella sp. HB161398]|uniref:LytR/AlgR family response regulator transcription factor n=1 Tax=Poseidonocella sp. HB161398 TaxID=2320855 RepID=UPI001F0F2F8C|nr:hypothetical protein [Poseidonocella sp. HB161398]
MLVTASAAHAIRAFEVGAVDFLLKLVLPERLALALDRVRNALKGTGPREIADTGQAPPGRLAISEGSSTVILHMGEIALLGADADFTRI